jgi:hypothetical protein
LVRQERAGKRTAAELSGAVVYFVAVALAPVRVKAVAVFHLRYSLAMEAVMVAVAQFAVAD